MSARYCISFTQAFTSNLTPSCEHMLNSNDLLLPTPSKSSVGLTTVLASPRLQAVGALGSTSSLPKTIRADETLHASLNSGDTQIQPANRHHARTSKWMRSRTQSRQPDQDKGLGMGEYGQGSIGPPKWGGKSGRRKSGRTWRRFEPRKKRPVDLLWILAGKTWGISKTPRFVGFWTTPK